MALTQTQVSQLYVSVFGRASEGEGNTYWQTDQPDMVTTANVMLDTDAAKDYFGTTLDDDQAFIEHIYLNTLGKTYAEDTEGVDYWVSELAGGKSKGEVVVALIEAAQATVNAGNAQDQFNNKVVVSDYTADKIAAFTTTEEFTGFISSVDHTAASVTTAQAAVDAAAPPVDGQTFTLTTGVDAMVGTEGDDTFSALASVNAISGALQDTLQSVDAIQGDDGTDALIGQVGAAGAANVYAGSMSDVEMITLTSFTAGSGINMANTTGATNLESKLSVASLGFTNAGNLVDFKVTSTKSDAWIDYTSAAVQGTTDSMTLTLSGADGGAGQNIEVGADAAADVVETLNVVSTGAANSVTLGGTINALNDALAGTTTLDISGSANLNARAAAMTALTTVDGSEATGNLTLNLTGAAGNVSTTTGSGDDEITVASFNNLDSIDAADGTDTVITEMTATVGTAVTLDNVEKLTLESDQLGAWSMNLDNATSLTDLTVYAPNTDVSGNALTVTKVAPSLTNVTFNGTGTTAASTITGLTYALKTTTGTSDSLTVNVINQTAAGVDVDKTDDAITTIASFTANGIENITLNTQNLGADDAAVTGVSGGVAFTSFADNALQSLTINSDTLVNIGTIAATTLNTISAADADGGVTVNVAAATNSANASSTAVNITTGDGVDTIVGGTAATNTISTGAGNDTITITGNAGNLTNTIDAGAGNDTIIGGDGIDNITTGEGSDTIQIDSANIIATKYDTITDFTVGVGGDKIDLAVNQATGTAITATTYAETAVAGALTAGLTVETTTNAGALTAAGVVAWATATGASLNVAGDNVVYLAVDDAADTGLFIIDDTVGVTAGTIETGEVTLLGVLTGVSDASTLTVDNFTDFLA